MKTIARNGLVLTLAGVLLLICRSAMADGSSQQETPWKKLSIDAGVFFTAVDSSVRFGTGLGVDIDVESEPALRSFMLKWTISRARSWNFGLPWNIIPGRMWASDWDLTP